MAQTTSTAVGLAAGIYSVTVTDNAGCQKTRSIEVTQPDELLIPGEIITNATCGLEDGELELVVSGGTPPFEYSIDGGLTFVPATIFVDLMAGSYDIVIRDDNGCTNSKSIVIFRSFTNQRYDLGFWRWNDRNGNNGQSYLYKCWVLRCACLHFNF